MTPDDAIEVVRDSLNSDSDEVKFSAALYVLEHSAMAAAAATYQQVPSDQQDTDGSDEDDHDATEAALSTAIAALLIAWLLPGPSSILGNGKVQWDAQVEAAIGFPLLSFIQRSAADLAASSGVSGASIHAADAAWQIYPRVLTQVAGWTHQTLEHLQARGLTERDLQTSKSSLSQAVSAAADQIAGAAAGYAKSEVRDNTAGRIGALWSIWKTKHDNRVRETHAELNNQKIPHGGRFVTETGAYLRYPRDPESPVSETAGCRCHLNYRFKPKAEDDYSEAL